MQTLVALALMGGTTGLALAGSTGVASAGDRGQEIRITFSYTTWGAVDSIEVTGTNQNGVVPPPWWGVAAETQVTTGWWWSGPVTIRVTYCGTEVYTTRQVVPTDYSSNVYPLPTITLPEVCWGG